MCIRAPYQSPLTGQRARGGVVGLQIPCRGRSGCRQAKRSSNKLGPNKNLMQVRPKRAQLSTHRYVHRGFRAFMKSCPSQFNREKRDQYPHLLVCHLNSGKECEKLLDFKAEVCKGKSSETMNNGLYALMTRRVEGKCGRVDAGSGSTL